MRLGDRLPLCTNDGEDDDDKEEEDDGDDDDDEQEEEEEYFGASSCTRMQTHRRFCNTPSCLYYCYSPSCYASDRRFCKQRLMIFFTRRPLVVNESRWAPRYAIDMPALPTSRAESHGSSLAAMWEKRRGCERVVELRRGAVEPNERFFCLSQSFWRKPKSFLQRRLI